MLLHNIKLITLITATVLAIVLISMDRCMLVSFDIPTQDNIYRYQCDKSTMYIVMHINPVDIFFSAAFLFNGHYTKCYYGYVLI